MLAAALLAGAAAGATARPAAAELPLSAGAYQVAVGGLCVSGAQGLTAAPARASGSAGARAAARLVAVQKALAPLLAKAGGLVPPKQLAAAHARMLAAVRSLSATASTLAGKLRASASPGRAALPALKAVRLAQADALAAFARIGAPPCTALVSAAADAVTLDTKPPVARAAKAKGRAGAAVALSFRLSDDSGVAAAAVTVYLGKARAGKPASLPFRATGAKAVTVRWRAPRYVHGFYRWCVVPRDRAGNLGARSCAAIDLR